MNPDALAEAVTAAVAGLVAEGLLPDVGVPEVRMERPKSREHGDYATNVALALAKAAGMPPRDLGSLLADRLATVPGIASAEVAGPGFVNIRLDTAAQGLVARTAVEAGPAWGHGRRGKAITIVVAR